MAASLLPFFIILTAGLVFSELFKRLHLSYVTTLILAGILIGPFALNLIQIDESLSFIGSIGIIFLMFIAGSEIKHDFFKRMRRELFVITSFNSIVPFVTGFAIGMFFGFDVFNSLLIGIIFISSSIAVIVPSLESSGLINKRVGKSIVSAAVFEDIGSLLLLAIFLQNYTQISPIPLPLYIFTILFIVAALKLIIPKLQKRYHFQKRGKDLFESKLRFVFVVLLGTVALFEMLGVHAIVAGFLIGILLSDSIDGKIENKVRTVSYGIFIPVFFLIIGMQTDLSVYSSITSLGLTVAIVLGLFISKTLSGWLAGRLLGFTHKESLLIGIATTPQLSTTLATAFVASEFGLLSRGLITSLVMLSVVTTLVTPYLIGKLSRKVIIEKEEEMK